MPYYKRGSVDQTEHFINAIEVIQSVIDDYGAVCPLKIFGDLNVQLPKNKILNRLGINNLDLIPIVALCILLLTLLNNLTVADFISEQSVNFTYFCDTLGVRTFITSPPIGGGRGIVMPMSVCLFVCVCVCPCFRKISKCNISVISQPIIMKLNIHIEYGYSVTDKYFQNFRSKVKVVGHRNVFP